MTIKKQLIDGKLSEMLRFAINGGISFATDFAVLIFFTEFVKCNYLVSSAISFTASVIVNYMISIGWVFKGVKHTGTKGKLIFFGSSLIGLGLNQLIMWIAVEVALLYYVTAKIISTVLVMIWNYLMKRKALFGEENGK